MLFSHDTEHSLACVVDLVNSSPAVNSEERLPDLAALAGFVVRHEVSEVSSLNANDLRAVHELRDAIRPVFGTTDDARAARIINSLVGRSPVTPRLTDHDGYTWHMHYFSPGASLAEHLLDQRGIAALQIGLDPNPFEILDQGRSAPERAATGPA